MKRSPTRTIGLWKLLVGVLFLMISGCFLDASMDPRNILMESIHWYNKKFESKMMNSCVLYVTPEKRAEFMTDSLKIVQKVTFYETSIIDIQFSRDGQPAKMHGTEPEKDVDKATVVLRYQFSVLPSVTVKTIIIEQEWNRHGNGWFVSPDLKKYLG